MARSSAPLALLPLLVLGGLACPREKPAPAGPAPLETKEVGAAPDAALSTENDTVERRRAAAFSGVLPGTFPKELPVYEPSSLVDFGHDARGSFAVFQTPDEPAAVRARYTSQLAARGFGAAGDTFTRERLRVRVVFESLRPGTRIRVEY